MVSEKIDKTHIALLFSVDLSASRKILSDVHEERKRQMQTSHIYRTKHNYAKNTWKLNEEIMKKKNEEHLKKSEKKKRWKKSSSIFFLGFNKNW